MSDKRQLVRRHVRQWAEELVDLTRRNRLLYFKHTASASLAFKQPAQAVVEALDRRGWGFFLPAPPPEDEALLAAYDPGRPDPDALVVDMTPLRYGPKIAKGLDNLAKRTLAEFLDAGLWVLYLGLGELVWTDVDGKEANSPLFLVPVELQQVGADKKWRLIRSENGESALNPALAVKLEKDFEIVLPTLEELPEPDLANVVAAVSKAVTNSSWRVRDAAVLTTFTFQKEVIYRDLRENEDEIVEHAMVRLLAEGPSSEVAVDLDFAPDDEEHLDERHPPEDLACVLDADASQRQCLIAARGGRSFVMDGPPGTGKSQTISNLVAQLLADGKTVLFVSEKAAALEVVANRLTELKLDPFVLSLHSRTATRKAVAQELGRALEERPKARERFDSSARATLAADRIKLTSYAVAVNKRREPLGTSLHDAIGRISQLDRLPDVPVPAVDLSKLDGRGLASLLDSAQRLGRSWGPVLRAEDFLWRNLRDRTLGAGHDATRRRKIGAASDALNSLEVTVSNTCDELRLKNDFAPVSAGRLRDLLEVLDRRLPISPLMLTTREPEPVIADLRELGSWITVRASIQAELEASTPQWRSIDGGTADRLKALEARAGEMIPRLEFDEDLGRDQLFEARQALDEAAASVGLLIEPTQVLATAFGFSGKATPLVAARLAGLGKLAGSATPPESTWLNPAIRAALDEARRVLSDLLSTYRARRDALAGVFTPRVLDLDLAALKARFAETHRGVRKMGSAYRADKKLIAATTVSGKASPGAIAKLDEALEWKLLADRLAKAEGQHAGILGVSYYGERDDADLDSIERAVAVADEALRLAGGDVKPNELIAQLARGATPDSRLPDATARTEDALGDLNSTWLFQDFNGREALASMSLDHLQVWLAGAASILDRTLAEIDLVNGSAGESLSYRAVRALGRQVKRVAQKAAEIDGRLETLLPHLGELTELLLDASQAEAAASWVEELRTALGGHVRNRAAEAMLRTQLTPEALGNAISTLGKTTDDLLDEFEDGYGEELRSDLMATFEDAASLLATLSSTLADATEWESFCDSRDALCTAGWAAVVEACESQRVLDEEVAPLFERSILQRWVDQVIDKDTDLRPKRAVDRDALQQQFRELDAAMTADAAARVINACSERRPRSLAGQAGIIQQQSQLKRRHKPVRQLLAEAGEAAQLLKPCFMMSPLSVSQFVPPGLRFDVVIFDEASQVREADAICCVYRGDQLVVAGDPKQLPPTSFFDRVIDTEEDDLDDEVILDFESVLDRCKAQGFPALPLNWHYRSRHESLITFSNRSFYEGRLHTFPGAVFERADLGVELFVVAGQYQRGGTRDNPIEAEAVVDRVVHHRRQHPDLTLGVVALSSAQQSAIESAIERRSYTEPELRQLVSDNRLDGFFVKNLENVQGDERDIIILSIGYGPDELGKFTMNFGPMNRPGGERRLNVAVTRARRRVEAVTSFRPGQIDSPNPTIVHLKRYLDYADRGIAALALDLDQSEGDVESPFEAEVVSSIRSLGYDAVPQVGVAGYRIDIGVPHPTEPGSYLLGVECDGAAYHSAKVARDRDRLRQQVLEGLGWRIHRIWSTAWFSDRAAEVERLRKSIESEIAGGFGTAPQPQPRPSDVEVVIEQQDFDEFPGWLYMYEEPRLDDSFARWPEIQDLAARPTLARQIKAIVEGSGPIHQSAVLDVLRDAWGFGRAGSKIRDAFDAAISHLVANGSIERDGEFLQMPGAELLVRGPSESEESPRKVKFVPPAELEMAVVQLLTDAGTAPYSQMRTHWARIFGWRRVGPDIEAVFEDVVDRLMEAGVVKGPDPLQLVR